MYALAVFELRNAIVDLNSYPITSPAYRLLNRQIFPFLFLRCETHPTRRPFLNRVDSGSATRSSCPGRQPYHAGWLVPYSISSVFNVNNLSGLFAVGRAPRLGVGKSFNRVAG